MGEMTGWSVCKNKANCPSRDSFTTARPDLTGMAEMPRTGVWAGRIGVRNKANQADLVGRASPLARGVAGILPMTLNSWAGRPCYWYSRSSKWSCEDARQGWRAGTLALRRGPCGVDGRLGVHRAGAMRYAGGTHVGQWDGRYWRNVGQRRGIEGKMT